MHVLAPSTTGDAWSSQVAWERGIQALPEDFPLQQRPDWPTEGRRHDNILLRIESHDDRGVAFVGVRRHRLRSLPGAWYLQVPKLGVGLPAWAVRPALFAVKQLSEQWWRVARVRIELCMLEDPEVLPVTERVAEDLGYTVTIPREYAHTLLVPVPMSNDAAQEQFHRSVFKSTRKVERAGHVLRPIVDLQFAERLASLFSETMSRSGARVEMPDMAAILRCTAANPDRYRVVGLFRGGTVAPDGLLAFRWCGCAGRYAYDLLAASTRLVDDGGQVPMMPAIMLDMFQWAREMGAREFDFGGVVVDADPTQIHLAGITRFKRLFGDRLLRVGSDLLIEPRAVWRTIDRASRKVGRIVGA